VYEQDFLDCSYGFRPRRSAHDALVALREGLMEMGGGVVLDVDIKDFFGSLGHGHLRSFLDNRVRDGVLRRAIDKWLTAGVMEEGRLWRPETGSPQGGVVSPLLSNVYLHEVLDKWFVQEVRPRLRGRSFLVRFADDFVIVCAREDDARRVMEVLPKRFGRYGLTLHPKKTRVVRFERPQGPRRAALGREGRRAATFDLLGFTLYWAKSKRGYWVVMLKTAKDRLARAVRKIALWCRRNRHLPIRTQHRALCSKLLGHNQYYGVFGNTRALSGLVWATSRVWHKWLNRRSQRRRLTWARFSRLLVALPLPPPKTTWSARRTANP
jgi:group II intron reverse transcriptase/maturase